MLRRQGVGFSKDGDGVKALEGASDKPCYAYVPWLARDKPLFLGTLELSVRGLHRAHYVLAVVVVR